MGSLTSKGEGDRSKRLQRGVYGTACGGDVWGTWNLGGTGRKRTLGAEIMREEGSCRRGGGNQKEGTFNRRGGCAWGLLKKNEVKRKKSTSLLRKKDENGGKKGGAR